MIPDRRPGLTIVETVLSIAIGLVLMGGVVATYYSVRASSAMSNARSMVGTIQTNIGMDKFRLGTPPPMTPVPSASATTGVAINRDSTGKPFWPDSSLGTTMPADPVTGRNTVMSYYSTLAPTALVAGDPTDRWDNPVFGSPAYGKGGWLYDENTGSFRINLSNRDYIADHPSQW